MNAALAEQLGVDALVLTKAKPELPVFDIFDGALALRAGTIIALLGTTHSFADSATIPLERELVAGEDFVVGITEDGKLRLWVEGVDDWNAPHIIGGGHFSPGSLATGRAGGDTTPGFDPFSLWDLNFRPACADPRGMLFVAGSRGAPNCPPFWVDKYLLAQDHLHGTSRLGATIADGRNYPDKVDGSGRYRDLNWHTAKAVLAHHGKQLLSLEEFFAAAYGVTEKTAADDRSEVTVLDAPRTSWCGMMQATGQRWVWGHDGDPDEPRASLFGGSYVNVDDAGSRYAVVDVWPVDSYGLWGARGRSDHLQLA